MKLTGLYRLIPILLLSVSLLLSGVPVAEAAPRPDEVGAPAPYPQPELLRRPAAATQIVYITGGGFSPSTLTLFGPTDIVWENRSGVTVTLRSGTPDNAGSNLYLPIVVNGDGSRARTITRTRTANVDFSVTLGPRDIFVQHYAEPGSYSFHLTEPPRTGTTDLLGRLNLSGAGLLYTSPQDGEDGVAVTRETILTFSAPLDPATVTQGVFTASSTGAPLDFRLHLSGDRRQVTLFYANPLPGNALVQVGMDGSVLRDAEGGLVDVDGDNVAGGTGVVSFTTLSLATVPGTSVCGRVFASQLASSGNASVNEPLQGVTITVDGRAQEMRAVTDNSGNFCLDPSPAGRFFVHIDGRTVGNATPEGGYYPFVGKAWQSVPGAQASVGDIYLPLVQPGALQPVSETEDVTIGFAPSVLAEHPEFAGVAITVPAGSLFYDDGSPGQKVGIAPVPPDRIPGQLPEGLNFPLVITVQTDGATNFDTPAPICFPNLPNPDTGKSLEPGEKTGLWSFNHDTGRFGVVGPMTANADGTLVCTDPGVGVPAPGWHSWNPGVPVRGGPSRPVRRPPPPPPPPDEDEECEPGEVTCEEKEGYEPSTNGCGPEWLPEFIPNWDNPMLAESGSCNFKPACDAHDAGYGTCNTPKTQTDTQFRNAMQASCASCYPNSDPISLVQYGKCIVYAEAFYQTVNTVGDYFYGPAQEEACECEECPGGVAGRTSLPPWLTFAGPVGASLAEGDEALTGLTYYMAVNLDTGAVQRGEAGSNGVAFEDDIILAPGSRYRIFLLHAETLYEDYMDVVTPASGEILELPPFYVHTDLGYDLDEDGLGALGEEVMGTDFLDSDSDDDGVFDGVEVQAGQNPLSGVMVQTGIIASAETPGAAVDVCVSGDVAAVADSDAGVAIFNVFAGMNPQIMAQVDTPGSAGGVVCDGRQVAVADGDSGLAVIDISDPANATITRQVTFGGAAAWSVAAANGKAYVGLSDGRVVQVDMAGGGVEKSLTLDAGAPVHDVVLVGDFLHAISTEAITSIFLDRFTVVSSEPLFVVFDLAHSRRRLAGGDGLLLAAQDQSAEIYQASLPIQLQYQSDINMNLFGWNHVIPNGAGLAVAASAPAPDSPADQFRVSVYDIGDLSTPSFVTEYATPGLAMALTIDKGLAYVADQDAGMQVINFQAADTAGITPTVTLESNFASGRFQAGAEMRLTALAQDDVQIRDVEFYLDDKLLRKDGSHPFEIRFTAPDGGTITVQVKATDTGGRFAWSDVQTRNAVTDAVIPEVLAFAPAWNERISQEDLVVQATFSESMNPATLTAGNFQLLDATDVPVPGGAVSYDASSKTATLTFSAPPPAGLHQAVLTSAITDGAGNALPRRAWNFEVTETLSGAFFTFSDDPGSYLSAMDMDGDWMVVGASKATVGGNVEQGAAYLFTRDPSAPSGWREVKKLIGSDGAAGDEFGRAAAISDDTVIVGAPSKELTSREQGQVYVFARNQGGADNWGEVTRFADVVGRARYFGLEVEIVGNTFVAVPTTVLKAAYVYRRSAAGATDWALLKEVPLDDSFGQNFGAGEAVALSADEQTLIASVPRLSIDANDLNEGVVRIFQQDAGGANNWGQTGELTASDPAEDAYFGGDIALDGDVLVVGSPFYDTSQAMNATGKLYIFVRDAGAPQGWRQVAVFDEPDNLTRVRTLGSVVGANANRVITTGGDENYDRVVYVYEPVNGNLEQWSRILLWKAENEPAAGLFSGIITTSNGTIATSAFTEASGEAAVFLLETGP